jgi:DNA-binding GntR family transcriptional regulator
MPGRKKSYSNYSLTDEIADILRARILKGEYKVGEKIKETHIAEELRVSRTPIREALHKLEKEGLIEYKVNRGCYARGITIRDVNDIYAIRKVLENLTMEWAVSRISADEIQQLHDKCDEMKKYVDADDSEGVLKVNKEFHDIIYNATGSRFMGQILKSYKEYIEQTQVVIFYEREYLQHILDEHLAILDRIEAHDIEGAKEAMDIHMQNSKQRTIAVYSLEENHEAGQEK